MIKTLRQLPRIFVAIVGFAVLVLPGPAIVVIPVALAILAAEFLWTRELVDKLKGRMKRM